MKTACLVLMSLAVVMTGCGDSKLDEFKKMDEIKRRTIAFVEKNPELANAEIKNLDLEYEGHGVTRGHPGDKYSGLLEIGQDGKTVMFALEVVVNDKVVHPTVNGEKVGPAVMKELTVFMEEVTE